MLFLCYVVCVETVSQIKSDWLIKRLNSVLPSNWGLLTAFYSCFDGDDSSSHHLYSTTSPDAAPQELRATSFNYSLRLFPPFTTAASLPPPARLQGRLTETAQWHTTWRPGWHAGLKEGAHTDTQMYRFQDTKKQQDTFCPFCSCVDTHTHKCQVDPLIYYSWTSYSDANDMWAKRLTRERRRRKRDVSGEEHVGGYVESRWAKDAGKNENVKFKHGTCALCVFSQCLMDICWICASWTQTQLSHIVNHVD